MKRLRLILEFYRKNLLATVFLLFFLAASLFYLIDVLGYLGYKTYSLDQMDALDLQDGLYVMPANSFADVMDNQSPIYDQLQAQDFSAIQQTVRPVGGYGYTPWGGGAFLNLLVCDEAFIQRFSFVDEGRWLSQADTGPEAPLQIVAGGFALAGVQVGDRLPLQVYNAAGEEVTFYPQVIGVDREPTMSFELGDIGGEVAAHDIFSNTNNVIYLSQETFRRMTGTEPPSQPPCFLILFREEATPEEKAEVCAFLDRRGTYLTFQQLRDHSQEAIRADMKQDLPLPLFMLGVSTFSMVAISALLTSRQLADYRIYYLVGYSRRRSFWDTFLAIFAIGGVAAGANLLYLLFLNHHFLELKSAQTDRYSSYLVMNHSAWYVLLFLVVSVLLSVLLPFSMLRKTSPIDLYRRPS